MTRMTLAAALAAAVALTARSAWGDQSADSLHRVGKATTQAVVIAGEATTKAVVTAGRTTTQAFDKNSEVRRSTGSAMHVAGRATERGFFAAGRAIRYAFDWMGWGLDGGGHELEAGNMATTQPATRPGASG